MNRKIETFLDQDGQHRWRTRSAGDVVAGGEQGYSRRIDMIRVIEGLFRGRYINDDAGEFLQVRSYEGAFGYIEIDDLRDAS